MEKRNPTDPPKQPPLRLAVLGAVAIAGVVLVCFLVSELLNPQLATARGSRETMAVGSLRAYASAQTMFRRSDPNGAPRNLQYRTGKEAGPGISEYCHDLRDLHCCLDGNAEPINLLDAAFAKAHGPRGTPKSGYLFLELKTIAGKPVNWVNDFALCATPARYGDTGTRTFIVSTSGTVYGKDLGKTEFVKDFPADPRAAGWVPAE